MFMVVIHENTARKGLPRHITHVLTLVHDGFGAVTGRCGEFRLMDKKIEPLQALDSGDESGL
jgi:hypothetical protein